MPKRSSNEDDPIKSTSRVLDEILAKHDPDSQKNPAAVALGRLGGLKGGKARAAKLSSKKRTEIAKKAARARWNKTQQS